MRREAAGRPRSSKSHHKIDYRSPHVSSEPGLMGAMRKAGQSMNLQVETQSGNQEHTSTEILRTCEIN
jgi:hypothetical protein